MINQFFNLNPQLIRNLQHIAQITIIIIIVIHFLHYHFITTLNYLEIINTFVPHD